MANEAIREMAPKLGDLDITLKLVATRDELRTLFADRYSDFVEPYVDILRARMLLDQSSNPITTAIDLGNELVRAEKPNHAIAVRMLFAASLEVIEQNATKATGA